MTSSVDPSSSAVAVSVAADAEAVVTAPGAVPATPPEPEPDPAELVRDAVLTAPGVVALHGGPFGAVGTYLPGRRVTGVRLTDDEVQVHVVAALGVPVHHTSAGILQAISSLPASAGLGGRTAHVVVEDVVEPAEVEQPALPPAPRDA